MARKRLADLIKTEAASQEQASPPTEPTTANPPAAEASPLPNTDQLQKFQHELQTLAAALATEKKQAEAIRQKLTELQANEQEISALNANLKREKDRVKQLQEQVEQLEPLATELEQAKAVITDLEAQIAQLSPPAPAPQPSLALAKFPPPLPSRYIAPQQPPSTLSDADIGWFD